MTENELFGISEQLDDTISRQGVLRLLNAVPSEEFATKAMLISGVNALPSAQPEIIRCKDCKHWTNNIGDSKLKDNYCNDEAHGFYYQCSEDDYCSFAERRTDEQTVS